MSHIALLLPELEAGGAQRVMLTLAKEFKARGHRVDLVLLRASGTLISSVPAGVNLVDLKAGDHGLGAIGLAFSSTRRLAGWLRRNRPEVMLSSVLGANLVAVLARRIARVSFRLAIRHAASVGSISGSTRRWLTHWLYHQADVVIALSSVMANDMHVKLGIPLNRISQIHNPVDAEFIGQQSKAPMDHPWLTNEELRVIISVGRLVPEKDFATLLNAFALLPRKLGVRLIIVGEGPERNNLEALSRERAIASRILFAGFDANPWRWMARADLFVLSSKSEGMPNGVLEARVLGLPIVLTEYDYSARDIGGSDAIVVRIGNPAELARAMAQGLEQDRPQVRMSTPASSTAAAYLESLLPSEPQVRACHRQRMRP